MSVRRLAGWSSLLALLVGLGYGLHEWLPPEPRWSRPGHFDFARLLPGGTTLAAWKSAAINGDHRPVEELLRHESPLALIDLGTGGLIRNCFDRANEVQGWACSPDGRFLAAASMDGVLWIADVHGGAEWQAVDRTPVLRGLIFSPDGEYLAFEAGDGTGRLLGTRTGRLVHSWPLGSWPSRFSAGGDYFMFHTINPPRESEVHVWDLRRGAVAGILEYAGVLAVSADGKTLFVQQKSQGSSQYDHVILWDLPSARPRGQIGMIASNHLRLALSPDGRIAALWPGSTEAIGAAEREAGGQLEFWEVPAGKRLGDARIAFDSLHARFAPDGKVFALLHWDRLALIEASTGRELWHEAYDPQAFFPNSAFLFASDSQSLVVQTRGDLQWRDAADGTLLETRLESGNFAIPAPPAWKHDRVLAYEIPQGGGGARLTGWFEQQMRRWLPRSWLPPEADLLRVYVFDARTRQTLFEVATPEVRQAMLSDDGELLLTVHTGEGDELLRCWDVPARKPLRWVLGVPLAIGTVLLLLQALVKWRSAKGAKKRSEP
jgi:WD40 repeat protein